MTEPVLLRELLTWVASRPRTYAEAMAAWRSHCPRHPVWDDAVADGLVEVAPGSPRPQAEVRLTARGRALLSDGQA